MSSAALRTINLVFGPSDAVSLTVEQRLLMRVSDCQEIVR